MGYDHISFPADLTQKDKELIVRQCENQKATSLQQVLGFAVAYDLCKKRMLRGQWFDHPETLVELILDFAVVIEGENETGFRHTPVTFANMEHAVEPGNIKRAMAGFVDAYVDCAIPAEDL